MALERTWEAVEPQAFTADGGQWGLVTVANTIGFKTKQSAYLLATGLPDLAVQIKVVLSETQLVVGQIDNKIANWIPLDISKYTVAKNAVIGAQRQPKNNIYVEDALKASYESDPTVAIRTIIIDPYGNFYTPDNPLPATFTGTISVGEVIIKGTNDNTIEPNADGSINVVVESVPSSNARVVSTYDEALAVAANSTVQIVSYTIPSGKTAVLQRAPVSGENIGQYQLLINGVTQDTVRTMFGGDLSQMFDFTSGNDSGLLLNAGDVISIEVTNPRPYIGNYNARIQALVIG